MWQAIKTRLKTSARYPGEGAHVYQVRRIIGARMSAVVFDALINADTADAAKETARAVRRGEDI